jgi:hypothetical protein
MIGEQTARTISPRWFLAIAEMVGKRKILFQELINELLIHLMGLSAHLLLPKFRWECPSIGILVYFGLSLTS